VSREQSAAYFVGGAGMYRRESDGEVWMKD